MKHGAVNYDAVVDLNSEELKLVNNVNQGHILQASLFKSRWQDRSHLACFSTPTGSLQRQWRETATPEGAMHLSSGWTPKIGQVDHVCRSNPLHNTQAKLGKLQSPTQASWLPLQTRRCGHLWKAMGNTPQSFPVGVAVTSEYMPTSGTSRPLGICILCRFHSQEKKVNKNPGCGNMEIRLQNWVTAWLPLACCPFWSPDL